MWKYTILNSDKMEEKYAKNMKELYEAVKNNYLATLTVEQKLELAKDPNISAIILVPLGEDLNPEIRIEVAKNLKMPYVDDGNLEKRLANDQNPDVKKALIENPNISRRTLEQLANDQNPEVRAAARKRLNEILRH